mgnify:CR=1 FL=1|tara:strand:+ start:757 stop:888 length:132 start_codon:yes stop_codon:yes gene_type:complete
MIGQIIELIKITKCKDKFSKIALGKNKIPESLKEVYNHIKYFK